MLKKTLLTLLLLTGALLPVLAEEITMIVVPREAKPIRIIQDIGRQSPVLLVTYRKAVNGVRLHAWDGESWIAISPKDYANGSFFKTVPSHAILVGTKGKPAPNELIPDGSWFPAGHQLSSTDPRVMIHLLGRHFKFDYPTWKRFASRYGYTVEEVNPGRVNVHWWHYRGNETLKESAKRNLNTDLKLWHLLPVSTPKPAAPVVAPMETKTKPSSTAQGGGGPNNEAILLIDDIEEKTEKEEPKPLPAIDSDPFSGEDIPAATVILSE